MAAEDDPEADAEYVLERWRAGRATELDLYRVVSAAMDQAAKRGLWRMLGEEPDPHDVQTAVVDAFRELWAKDPCGIDRLVGLAATIADKRGRDRGRAVIAENKKMRKLTDKLGDQLQLAELDAEDAAARAELMTLAQPCFAALTPEQRDVLTFTYVRGGTLSDWAHQRGKTHQAAVRQRKRAEAAVLRCVQRRREGQGSSGASPSKRSPDNNSTEANIPADTDTGSHTDTDRKGDRP